jgi:hypothetical protein
MNPISPVQDPNSPVHNPFAGIAPSTAPVRDTEFGLEDDFSFRVFGESDADFWWLSAV